MIGQILGFVSSIIKPVAELVDDVVTTDEEREGLKAKLKEIENKFRSDAMQYEAKIVQAQADIVKAEVQGKSWMQRNWRPILMLSIVAIIINNYILFPYLGTFIPLKALELPAGLWTLMSIGVGGYVGGRSLEKIKGV